MVLESEAILGIGLIELPLEEYLFKALPLSPGLASLKNTRDSNAELFIRAPY
jgi:hypothetical protein